MKTLSDHKLLKSVPKLTLPQKSPAAVSMAQTGGNGMMMACCALMVAGFGYVVYAAPASQSWSATLLSGVPLLICIGGHAVMHRFMGKSCHGSSQPSNSDASSALNPKEQKQ